MQQNGQIGQKVTPPIHYTNFIDTKAVITTKKNLLTYMSTMNQRISLRIDTM